ncbi:hypothetical protein [Patulibacter sp. SYSU D01012]|uniref:hypothetical protein n=1 Tax=Patulibacter sp. SYSU D01012 TaxID=2817381 RepID=UPI001B3093CA|nr:hypothetical protein [Patulibacter sp. SYSU D01012]
MSDDRPVGGADDAPPTKEFGAVSPTDAVTPQTDPGPVPADATTPAPGTAQPSAAPIRDADVDESPTGGPTAARPNPTGAAAPPADGPAPDWKTPPAAGLPPKWQSAEGADDASVPSSSSTLADKVAELFPEDQPERIVAAALVGGVLAAILLRTLARR